MNHIVGKRASASLGIHNFDFHKSYIRSVSLPSARILDARESYRICLTGCLDAVSCHFLAPGQRNGFNLSALEADILKGEKEAVFFLGSVEFASVHIQFHLICGAYYIDRLYRSFGVVPVTYDIYSFRLDVHPSVPHHLVGEIAVLRYSQRVNNAAAAIVLHSAEVGVGVREYDLGSSRTYSLSASGPLAIVVVPPAHVFHHELVLIMIVGSGIALYACVAHSGVETVVARSFGMIRV